MIKFFFTTTIIVVWCLFLSIGFALLRYQWIRYSQTKRPRESFGIFPVLLLGPITLVVGFQFFETNLIFPIHILSTTGELIRAAFWPAIALVFASGLMLSIRREIVNEWLFWQNKPFVTASHAFGVTPHKALRKLILTRALIEGWLRCLPWIFGELIVVEAMFNAPGLGWEAWEAAKLRDFTALAYALVWLLAIYFVVWSLATTINRWLGRRLESYA